MKLANKAYVIALILLTFVFSMSAQTTTTTTTTMTTTRQTNTVDTDARPEKDNRNTAPTVGTGGPPGGPTGLFTVYDGQTLRRGEFTFSAAYSNFDRDPGNVDIVEVPISFQIGVTNHVELFFNTDAYRGVKVNSPRNLSSFYLPNSQLRIGAGNTSGGAIVLAPQGAGTSQFANQAVFRPQGLQPFTQFPFIGGNAGTFGFTSPFFSGPVFGFPAGTNATLGPVRAGGNGADLFPGIGSVFGSILPGVVLQTVCTNGAATCAPGAASPSVFSLAPSYLPDAPFINRTYGESAFNTFTVGAKIRFTDLDNPIGIGVIPFYRFYADSANDFSGFNQLQRGSSAGSGGFNPFSGNRGDIGAVLFGDARLQTWVNVSANLGYIFNGDIKGDFGGSEDVTFLDRGDEVLAGVAVDFPVNKYFQPILEARTTQYVGGRTPNAFENNPFDGLAGARIFPARWFGFSFAYRYHFNQQDRDSFDDEDSFTSTVLVPGAGTIPSRTITTTTRGVPSGFRTSSDPHGFIVQVFAGRRDKRQAEIINIPANVTNVTLSEMEITIPCAPGFRPREGTTCSDDLSVNVATTAVDAENDVLTYNYTVSGGRVVGQGANVSWDLSGVRPGTYTITSGVDDGCGVCGQTQTRTITVRECDCVPEIVCACPTLSVSGPSEVTPPGGTMTFTASLGSGSPDGITYTWAVSAGSITEGQGTPSIRVQVPSDGSVTNVTATVTIGGTQPTCDCDIEASETAGVAGVVTFEEFDTFEDLKPDDIKARLDNFFARLQGDPTAQGYIINYGPARAVTARERLIRQYITFRNQDPARFTLVQGSADEGIRTRLILVPAGATPPQP
ncbi:MAG: hypothetical protein M3Q99_14140 [Acidobacteriota bacterium]|nr:hypothetical protein [Acidobacteriota bacterium]